MVTHFGGVELRDKHPGLFPLKGTHNQGAGKDGQQAVFNTSATRVGFLHFLLHPFIPSATT